jgi:hypothetical protein
VEKSEVIENVRYRLVRRRDWKVRRVEEEEDAVEEQFYTMNLPDTIYNSSSAFQ